MDKNKQDYIALTIFTLFLLILLSALLNDQFKIKLVDEIPKQIGTLCIGTAALITVIITINKNFAEKIKEEKNRADTQFFKIVEDAVSSNCLQACCAIANLSIFSIPVKEKNSKLLTRYYESFEEYLKFYNSEYHYVKQSIEIIINILTIRIPNQNEEERILIEKSCNESISAITENSLLNINIDGKPRNVGPIFILNKNFEMLNLTQINLSGATIYGTNFTDVRFIGANFEHSEIKKTMNTNVQLFKCYATLANFNYSDLSGIQIIDSNFSFASFIGANLSEAYWAKVDFSKANFSYCDLSKTNFLNNNFASSNIYEIGVVFYKVILSEDIDLTGIILSGDLFGNPILIGFDQNRNGQIVLTNLNNCIIDRENFDKLRSFNQFYDFELLNNYNGYFGVIVDLINRNLLDLFTPKSIEILNKYNIKHNAFNDFLNTEIIAQHEIFKHDVGILKLKNNIQLGALDNHSTINYLSDGPPG